jgi:NAD+ diphosphatase
VRPGPPAGLSHKLTVEKKRVFDYHTAMNENTKFCKELIEPENSNRRSFWFIFRDDHLLVHQSDNGRYALPFTAGLQELKIETIRTQYLGRYNNIFCYSAEAAKDIKPPTGMSFLSLRLLYGLIDPDLFPVAGYGFHLMKWNQTFQYCSRCGARTKNMENERAKICENCNLISYPKISPAIIVAIVKKNELLLAQSSRFRKKNMYSVLAGFVEPGETLEGCVKREIKEEVNIEVENIRYFGSQPWPFPDSLMIGFTADYKSGELVVDGDEIIAAGWFTPDALPDIPGKLSIARQLIDWFIGKYS